MVAGQRVGLGAVPPAGGRDVMPSTALDDLKSAAPADSLRTVRGSAEVIDLPAGL